MKISQRYFFIPPLLVLLTLQMAIQGATIKAFQDKATGQYVITDNGKLVLRYNYLTNQPGALLSKIAPGNLMYARARSDYIHPLYGPDGEELTLDWPVDHPHHRGIYWAWPEVDYRGERGDLHALQRVFARPTGRCTIQDGDDFAQIEAENLWLWEDREPIVREVATIRAWHSISSVRQIELKLQFTALNEDVSLARRATTNYGGLNIRLGPVKSQEIHFHTDPVGTTPRKAWADLSGIFTGSKDVAGLTVLQTPTNPHYPGDWIQFPEINWFQPTFPFSGTRWVLKKNQPLILNYRLLIHAGRGTTGGNRN